jgi:hypothetical protein
MADGVGKFALLDVLDPDAKDPDRHVVLFFAGNGAGVTAIQRLWSITKP